MNKRHVLTYACTFGCVLNFLVTSHILHHHTVCNGYYQHSHPFDICWACLRAYGLVPIANMPILNCNHDHSSSFHPLRSHWLDKALEHNRPSYIWCPRIRRATSARPSWRARLYPYSTKPGKWQSNTPRSLPRSWAVWQTPQTSSCLVSATKLWKKSCKPRNRL